MDTRSHILFADSLLSSCYSDTDYSIWGSAPDIDNFWFHRYYRHRISTIPNIISEAQLHPINDKESIILCILSHLYLDTFNGWVSIADNYPPLNMNHSTKAYLIDSIGTEAFFPTLSHLMFGNYPEGFYNEEYLLFLRTFNSCFDKTKLINTIAKRLSEHGTIPSDIILESLNEIMPENEYNISNIYPINLYKFEELYITTLFRYL